MPITTYPTISEVERISAIGDPVIRNLRITQCYHELALALAERTAGNANWCTFATWASKQAGHTIRREDLARRLEKVLGTEATVKEAARNLAIAARRIGVKLGMDEIVKLILKVLEPEAAFTRSSEAVARGNLKVFAEIGREFARFYADCLNDLTYDSGKITHFCGGMRPGEPPEGQEYLRRAFLHIYQAFFEENPKKRHELMLLANLEIGFHEQTRLQPEISEALVAPVITPEAFTRNMVKVLRPEWGEFNELMWFFMRLFGRLTALDEAVRFYLAAAQRQTQFIVTESMMTLEAPHNNLLRLGDDLAGGFPPALQQITNPELAQLIAHIDPTPDSLHASGAEDWGDLPDRLHFIADLFRIYQTSDGLFAPPFTHEQSVAIKENVLPSGRL